MESLTAVRTEIDPGVAFAALFRHAGNRPGARYLSHYSDGEWQSLTWGEAASHVRRIGAGLLAAGLERGGRVVLLGENRYEWLLCDLAIMAAGGVTVPIYPSLPATTVAKIATSAGARLGIASTPALGAKLDGTDVRVIGMERELREWLAADPPPSLAAAFMERAASVRPEEVATIVYTSGTTGESKGAVLLHGGLVAMAKGGSEAFKVTQDDVLLSVLPWAHVFERLNGLFTCTYVGAEIWVSRGMDHLVEDIQAVKPTIAMAVPRLFEKVRDRVQDAVRASSAPKRAVFRLSMSAAMAALNKPSGARRRAADVADGVALAKIRQSLTGPRLRFFISGGAPLGIDVEEFFWALRIPLLQGWGMTELSSGATGSTFDRHRFGSVGVPLPGVEVAIADDGEILCKSPGRMVEYYGLPAATADSLDGEWLKTGDIGRLDADGFLHITDRKKELIKTATGKIVAPLPIESRLTESPLIEWAVLVGDSRPFITALIAPDWQACVRAAGEDGDRDFLIKSPKVRAVIQAVVDRVNSELAPFETVKAFTYLPDSLSEERDELTPTLKIKRRIVDRHYAGDIEEMYRQAAAAHAKPAA